MDRIIRAVTQLADVPGSWVDCGRLQGHDAMLAHLRRAQPWATDDTAEAWRRNSVHRIAELESWIHPFHLPDDYRFFLEQYGGLHVNAATYYFDIYGIGPAAYYGYEDVQDGYTALFEQSWLGFSLVALQHMEPQETVYFFLDLKDTSPTNRIIAIPAWDKWDRMVVQVREILRRPDDHPAAWASIAASFTDWLELAAATRGMFGHLFRTQNE